jgi:hypothetical protein
VFFKGPPYKEKLDKCSIELFVSSSPELNCLMIQQNYRFVKWFKMWNRLFQNFEVFKTNIRKCYGHKDHATSGFEDVET